MRGGVLVRQALVVIAIFLAYHHERLALHALFVSRGNEGFAFTLFTWCGFLVIFPIAVLAARYPKAGGLAFLLVSFAPAAVATPFVPGMALDELPRVAAYLLPIALIGAGLVWVGKSQAGEATFSAICGYVETAVAVATWVVAYVALRFNGLVITILAWAFVTAVAAVALERGGHYLLRNRTRSGLKVKG
jgi:hypothetical protein